MSRGRTAFALACSIRELCRQYPDSISGDATFQENITDVGEAHRRWRNLLARLERKYPKLKIVGVWERQKRGAWHVHYVASARIDVGWMRDNAIACGFGPQMKLQPVHGRDGFRSKGVEGAVSYCCKYLAKELDKAEEGVRMVFYHNRSRYASTRFRWVGGMAKLYRKGRSLYSETFGIIPNRKLSGAMPLIMRMGWECLTGDEQWDLLVSSELVRRWWYGPCGDESPFPF